MEKVNRYDLEEEIERESMKWFPIDTDFGYPKK